MPLINTHHKKSKASSHTRYIYFTHSLQQFKSTFPDTTKMKLSVAALTAILAASVAAAPAADAAPQTVSMAAQTSWIFQRVKRVCPSTTTCNWSFGINASNVVTPCKFTVSPPHLSPYKALRFRPRTYADSLRNRSTPTQLPKPTSPASHAVLTLSTAAGLVNSALATVSLPSLL